MTAERIEHYLPATPRGRDELLTNAQVAEWLHVKPNTLAIWRMEKRGPRPQPIGKRVFYRANDVQAWLDEQRDSA